MPAAHWKAPVHLAQCYVHIEQYGSWTLLSPPFYVPEEPLEKGSVNRIGTDWFCLHKTELRCRMFEKTLEGKKRQFVDVFHNRGIS